MKIKKLLAIIAVLAFCLTGCGSDAEGKLSSFTASTLDGGSFTQKDLADKDLTIINFWATFCAPCVQEMPDIASYARSLPDNVQLITVCLDGEGDVEGAKAILAQAGYQGTTLLSGDGSFEELCRSVQVIPTTIFVNSRGKIVGDAIIGGQADLAASFTQAADKALKECGKPEMSFDAQAQG